MTITARALGTSYLDDSQLIAELKIYESTEPLPYADSAVPAKATIGIGVNITLRDNMALVLNQLGVFSTYLGKVNADRAVAGLPPLTKTESNQIYSGVVDDFEAVVAANPIVSSNAGTGKSVSERALQDALNTKLLAYGSTAASFSLNEIQAKAVTNQIILGYSVGPFVDTQGKQGRLDAILGNALGHDTQEYKVLMSLFYNGEGTIPSGGGLATAVQNGNRAEAWFEIRYNTNKGALSNTPPNDAPGVATRRYSEAEQFGLYNNPSDVGDAEARQVYGMYTQHSDTMRTYDDTYGSWFNLTMQLQPAATYLINQYGQGKQFDALNIYVSPSPSSSVVLTGHTSFIDRSSDTQDVLLIGEASDDTFDGGSGNDVLYGGTGLDILRGGAGNDILNGADGAGGDILNGGIGMDTYYADDGDTIKDSDGQGVVYKNGKKLTFATRQKGETLYTDANGNSYLQVGTSLLVNDPLVIQNYTNGDLGLTLEEYDPNDPLKKAFKKAEVTKSPIVLDLDGNGIATQGVSNGTFFDYDNNGFAERTGWATSGDGILVRDLNGNSAIDNGTELFGNQTKLTSGQTAANGFAAMADLDSNSDGKLDNQDAAWNELKIWQDSNTDGVTDAGELKTLADLGIQSIDTGYTTNTSTDANGNIHKQQGSYTKADGSTATAEDIWFKVDQASTRNQNLLAISETIRNLPEIQGKGNVASLRQVLAQQEANGVSTLKNLIAQFAAETDPLARSALVTSIIYEWTGVTSMDPLSRAQNIIYGNAIGDARKLYAMEALLGEGYVGVWCWNTPDPNPHGPAAAVLLPAFDEFANSISAKLMQQTQYKDLYGAISYTWDATTQTLNGDLSGTLPLIAATLDVNREQGKAEMVAFITNLTYTSDLSALDTRAFQDALAVYGQDVVTAANTAWRGMVATQGNDRLTGDGTDENIPGWGGNDQIYGGDGNDTLQGEEGNDALYGQDGNDTLDGGVGNDLLDGGVGNDTYLFGRGAGQDTILSQDSTANKRDVLKLAVGVLPADIDLVRNVDDLILTIRDTGDRVTVAGYFVNDGVAASSLEAIEFDGGITTWDFAAVKAMLPTVGTEGNDQLRGYNTAELIDGLGGNDVIEGRGGDDVISGGAGNDTLLGQVGNDILDGGVGNDSLDGGVGNDTYVFGRGSAQDTVIDYDTTVGNLDSIQIAAGVLPSDVTVTRDQNNLHLSITNPDGTTDKLTVQGWFTNDASKIEKVVFADDATTVWDVAALNTLSNIATENADYLSGTFGDDVINGLGGNDTILGGTGNDALDGGTGDDNLQGEAGNDNLSGGEGSDTLVGGYGNDTLDGGAGNDVLYGGNNDYRDSYSYYYGSNGNDTYVFGRGSGQDTVIDYDTTVGNLDTIQIAAGVLPSDVTVTRDQNNLHLSITNPDGTTVKLTVQGWFTSDASKIERVVFADDAATVWDVAVLNTLSNIATENADYLSGTSVDDVINSLGGNDTILGGAGNDTLDGGAGNDVLYGGNNDYRDSYSYYYGSNGNDTYVFGRGSGQDTVIDYDTTVGNLDTIQIAAGVLPSDVSVTRDQNNLHLSITNPDGTTDKLAVQGWFTNDASKVERVVFVDDSATVWDVATLSQAAFVGTDQAETISGTAGNDSINGLGGDDTLQGGAGDDVYIYNLGDGLDKISDQSGNLDTIQFGSGINADAIRFGRNGSYLVLSINGTTDGIAIEYGEIGELLQIEQIQFANGVQWTLSDMPTQLSGLPVIGTHGDDTLSGGNGADTLIGGTGNDTLYGYQGNDTYEFNLGGGQDTIVDYGGNLDTIKFGAGIAASDITFIRSGMNLVLSIANTTDQITIQNWGNGDSYRIEQISFADGSIWDAAKIQTEVSAAGPVIGTANADNLSVWAGESGTVQGLGGNDTLSGGNGADTLIGGIGNDTLYGNQGNDTYEFNLGDGQDTIVDYGGNLDTIKFGAGITASDITFIRSGMNLVLSIANTTDQIAIQNWGSSTAYRIEQISFADGSTWDATQIQAKVPAAGPIIGTANADNLSVWAGESGTVQGLGGNDTLSGGNGADTLIGGIGNDTLYGNQGNDTYEFNLGDGQDTIVDYGGNLDTIKFGAGITASDITFIRSGMNLVLSIANTTDQIAIQNWGSSTAYRIEQISFADGSTWDATQIQAKVPAAGPIIGTANADNLSVWAGESGTVQGLGGNDTLSGGNGADTLIGGIGNDTLYGNQGNDTYEFNLGDGQDTIVDYGGNLDTIKFGAGITASDITFIRSGMNLVLSIANTTDQITIQNWGNGDSYRIEQISFADGSIWDAAKIQTEVSAAGPVIGTANADNLSVWAGESGTVQGLGGNDTLSGGNGADTLIGGIGNDTLYGNQGNDTYEFNLGDGQDTIVDYGGNLDTIKFGAGITASDITFIRSGMNLVLSIANTTDQITIQNWGNGDSYRIEQISFADGSTWDATQIQAKVPAVGPIIGTANNDSLSVWSGESGTVQGMGGNDSLSGGNGADTLIGGAGDDYLQGGAGNDTYVFNLGDGQDTINDGDGTAGNLDTLKFGAGINASDITFTRSGNNLVLGINGTTDQITIQNWGSSTAYRIERIEFTDANNTVWDAAQIQANIPAAGPVSGTANADNLSVWSGESGTVQGLGGNDYLSGGNGADTLIGGAGDDYLQGGAGNDTYVFNLGDGQDTINDGDGTAGNLDTLKFGAGINASDITFMRSSNNLVLGINGTTDQITIQNWGSSTAYRIERIEFTDANNTVWDAAQIQANIPAAGPVSGTANADNLSVWSGESGTVQGLGGNDYLSGGNGADTLIGGAGDDYLQGGAGNDTYVFNLGDGQDTINDGDGTAGNLDTLKFGAGINASDITFMRSSNNLVLGINGTTDQITIQNWGSSTAYRIERIEFTDANNTVWDAAQIQANIPAAGPIIGTDNADNLSVWSGESGAVQGLGGNDSLSGGNGADTLIGGTGNDTLYGNQGNDTYEFNLGDGQDTIVDYGGNLDTIKFGAGITPSDITFTRSGNHLVLSIANTPDQITIQNWGSGDGYRIEQIRFADGSIWDAAKIQTEVSAAGPVIGTANADNLSVWAGESGTVQGLGGNDTLSGGNGADTLIGGAGDDYLQGGAGNDTYVFNLGDGQDTIYDGDGTTGNIDTIRFGAGIAASDITLARSGNDLVLSINGTTDQVKIQNWGYGDYYRIERVEFADGTAWDAANLQAQALAAPIVGTIGNDTLYGDAGNNTLDGGAGNDNLQGGAGNDTYLFNLGGGQDTIYDADSTAGNVDTIRFGAEVVASDIAFMRSGMDLVLSINGTTDQLKIQNWGYGDNYRIEQMEFADGTVWDIAQIQAFVSATPITGTEGGDVLQSWAGETATLRGLGGDDNLYGNDGNDTLEGGAGNDYLIGGAGNDTYLFNFGDGQDMICDYDSTAGNVDTIRFGAGIAASDITFTRSGMDLVLGINGTTDQVTIQNWGYENAYRVERVEFADGTVWDAAYLQTSTQLSEVLGTSGDDVLMLWAGESGTLQGLDGNDTLMVIDGNNTLAGGAGNDYLIGGLGDDVYVFNLGDGQDEIEEWSDLAGSVDTVRFGAGILPDDITFSFNGGNLVLSINGTTDQLTIWDWAYDTNCRVERVEFADGTVWDAAYLQNRAAMPIVDVAGEDYLNAYSYLASNGYLLNQNVNLQGLDGNDILYGGEGNDTLDGGIGNDYLDGGAGNDAYLFNLGDGQDTIAEYDSTSGNVDTIRFGVGIAASDISFTRSGMDLLLGINGTTDQVTILNWSYEDSYHIERVEFADGTVWDAAQLQAIVSAAPIVGTEDADYLQSGAGENATLQGFGGDDSLYGNDGNDTLEGGAGNDYMEGGIGNDTYLFNLGGGQDTISEYDPTVGNVDTIHFGVGIVASDIRFGRNGSALVLSINGTTDQVTIQSWEEGNDCRIERVEFADGTVWGAADLPSQLSGLPVMGTSGNDYLTGGTGNDTYLFNLGSGQDTIYEYDPTVGNIDTIHFGAGIAASDITMTRSGMDLVLGINGTTDQVTIQYWGNEGSYHIERVEFADGTVWDAAQIQAQIPVANTIVGSNGNDNLSVWQGETATLQGMGGDDYLFGNDGNDTLDGGTGDDYLIGSAGNDTYLFNLGGGQDTIVDWSGLDTIRFGAGISVGDITFTRSGMGLVLSINGTTDQLKIQNWGYGDYCRIEQVEFVDGTVWGAAQIQAQIPVVNTIVGSNGNDNLSVWLGETATLQGLGGNDNLVGNNGNDTLDGGAGNDTLYGHAGDDTYLFNLGGGQDTITDYSGSLDTIRFGAGITANDITMTRNGMDLVLSINGTTDQLKIQNWGYGDYCRIEQVEFADGTVWGAAQIQAQIPVVNTIVGSNGNDNLSVWLGEAATLQGLGGDDYLYGNDGNDTLEGGAGNDALMGSTGNDTYIINLGDGQDTISESDSAAGNFDTIRFGTGIAAGNITFMRSGLDLVLGINGTTDQVTIQNWGYGDAYRIERVEFADGTAWDMAQIQAQIPDANTVTSTDGNDTLSAWVGENTTLQGLGGNDELYGNDGNDTMDGGAGNDYLEGGVGNDTYLFNLGGGQDTIYEYDYTAGNVDTIRFGAGIAASDITFTRSDTDLVLSINGTTDQVTIQGWGYDASSRIERMEFADGMVWDAAYIQAQTSTTDIIGSDGSDYLYGDGWNNNITGGAGDDYLVGGSGNDTYLFSRGFGQDVLSEADSSAGNIDQVIFASDILPSDILVSSTLAGDLVLSISGTNDSLTVSSWLISDANKIEKVCFADGTAWSVDDLTNMLATMPTEADDSIVGTSRSDTLNALGGNDVIFGGAGADVLMGGSGDDVLYGGSGSDLLYGGDGVDSLYADSYYTDTGNDLLDGGAGDDYIDSSVANDLIIGGAGTDYIYDENGKDVLLFNRGDGQDTYDLYTQNSSLPAQRTISLGGGISYSDLAFSINGTSLVLELGNADSMTFDCWFSAEEYKSIKTLQLITETMPEYDPNSTDPLLNIGIQQFEFIGLVNQFEAAITTDPTITTWQLAPHLSDYYFGGSDTQALGGAMAYQYGKFGTLSGLSDAEIKSQLNDASFGVNNQSIQINNAPVVIATLIDQIGTQGQLFEFAVPAGTFTDINQGDVLTYTAMLADGSALPSWLDFDAATQTFSGTPNAADVRALDLKLTATDTGSLSATTNFVINMLSYNADGSYISYVSDGQGKFTTTHFDVNGNRLSDYWSKADGSSGSDAYGLDGSHSIYIIDTLGTATSQNYDASGHLLNDNWIKVDGSSGSDTFNLDGSHSSYTLDTVGTATSSNYDTTGRLLNDYWLKTNGFAGQDAYSYNPDGSSMHNWSLSDGGQGVDVGSNHLVLGGNGVDAISGSADNGFFAGRLGNDTISTGDGADIIAFNQGDGMDVVNGGIGTDNTITLGGGIQYSDLALSKTGNDLILEVGNGDQITFAGWYDTSANYKSVFDLQIMADAMAAFDATSTDPLLNQAVQNFDFTAIAASFDQVCETSATFMHWSVANSLLAAHLSGSDTAALGGDLAHQYGTNGSFTGMNLAAAQDVLNVPQFGAQVQTLRPLQGLQGGAVTL